MKYMKKHIKIYAGFEVLVSGLLWTRFLRVMKTTSDTASFPEKRSPQQKGRFPIECYKPSSDQKLEPQQYRQDGFLLNK
jgi:hypothetical protein